MTLDNGASSFKFIMSDAKTNIYLLNTSVLDFSINLDRENILIIVIFLMYDTCDALFRQLRRLFITF